MKYLLGLFIALTLVGCPTSTVLEMSSGPSGRPPNEPIGVVVYVGSGGCIARSVVDLGEAAVNPNLPASRTLQGNYVFGGNVQVLGSFQQGQTSKNVNVSAAAGAIGSITNPYFGNLYDRGTVYQQIGQQWVGLIANSFAGNGIASIAYGSGTFCAVSFGGIICTSTTGATWSGAVANPFGGSDLAGIAFGQVSGTDTFVVVGVTGKIGFSINAGANWALAAVTPFGVHNLGPVAFGNGVFVAAEDVAPGDIAYSVDGGNHWTIATTNPFGGTAISSMTFGNGVFVAVGLGGKIGYSIDLGKNWILVTGASNPFNAAAIVAAVSFGNGVFVAGDNMGEIGVSSDNGNTWTLKTNPFGALSIFTMAYNFGVFQAAGSSGSTARSYDNGQTWGSLVTNPFGSFSILSIASGTTNLVAVGQSGSIATAGWNAAYSLVQPVPGETSLGTRKRHFTQIVVGAAFAAGDNDVDLGATPQIPIGTKAVHVFGYFNAAGATVNTYMYLRNTNFEVAGYGFSANAAQGGNIQGDIYLTTDRIVRFTVPPIGTGVADVNIWMDYYWI